jgi:2-oxoglutarate dehydrogenase E2 component (dihydrolipoamide succinyltransferase)
MATKVLMPQMGESVFEGTLTKWLKKVGDAVVQDEPLFEISTDKIDSEIPSPATGILSEILVPEGKTIQINTVLAIITETGEEAKETVASRPEAGPSPAEVPEAKPEAGSENLPEAPEAEEIGAPELPSTARPQPAVDRPTLRPQDIRTSPLVRKLARENSINLSEIQGTGLEGRITKEDVLRYVAQREAAPAAQPQAVRISPATPEAAAPETPAPAVADVSAGESAAKAVPVPPEVLRFMGETETVPMTPMRKAIAEHMILSKRTSAHVNTFFEVDMSAVVKLRESQKIEFMKREGIPLTYSPFFAKALVDVVREFPVFTSSVSGDNIIYKKPVNLGIAVALDTGLIVPVVKDAHLKSFTGLALSIYDLAERARSKRLKPDDVQNGTISMTNPGSYGGLFATPIISQPQVAILGIGGIEKRPVVIEDAIAIRSMAYLSLTFDHRVIDGAVADRFMARLKERLQTWTQWID